MKLSEFTAKLIDAGGVHTTVVRQDGVPIPAIRFAEAFVLVSNPTNIEVFTYSIVERHDEEAHRVFLSYNDKRISSYGWETKFPQHKISSFKYNELDTLLKLCVYTIKHHTPLYKFEKWLNENYEYGVIKNDDKSGKENINKVHNIDLDYF